MRIKTESEQPLIKMSSSQGELDLPWLQHAGLMTVVHHFVLHTLGLSKQEQQTSCLLCNKVDNKYILYRHAD